MAGGRMPNIVRMLANRRVIESGEHSRQQGPPIKLTVLGKKVNGSLTSTTIAGFFTL
jgi:hypothetical protein